MWALKIADFLGQKYGNELREDQALFSKILEVCSLENMRRVFDSSTRGMLRDLLNLPPEKALKTLDVYRDKPVVVETHESEGFIRKGKVGDWKTHFTVDQIEKTKAWILKNTEGSDVMNLWSDIDLP